jgi:serine protease Do
VHPQDILLELNTTATNARFPEEIAPVRKRIADLPIGSDVMLTIKRGAQTLNMPMKTAKLESSVGEEREFKTWGITVRDISRAYANERQLDDDKGVVVTGLSPGYPAAKAELGTDDVIVRVNEQDVEDLDAFTKIYDESVKKKDATVLVDFKRRRSSQQTVLKVTYAP